MKRVIQGCLLGWMFALPAFAWNSAGHQVVAQIAWLQLTPEERAQLLSYDEAVHMGYQPKSWVQSAAWLDWFRCKAPECRTFKYYHYIDYPYSPDGVPTVAPRSVNLLTAMNQARARLSRRTLSDAEKGLQLRILMHIVADAHQPMHAVSLYSRAFPEGDQGGNRFLLGENEVGPQLHAYWDRGGGYLKHYQPYTRRAANLLDQYPCDVAKMDLNPHHWVQESFRLAREKAYTLKPFEAPSQQYQDMVQSVTEARLALAGCRLGALLKETLE